MFAAETQKRAQPLDGAAANASIADRPLVEIADEIQNRVVDHMGRFARDVAAAAECAKGVQREEERWDKLNNRTMEANYAKAEDTVKLNVRGKVFETFKENLVREKGTYFHCMVCNKAWKVSKDGNETIDTSAVTLE